MVHEVLCQGPLEDENRLETKPHFGQQNGAKDESRSERATEIMQHTGLALSQLERDALEERPHRSLASTVAIVTGAGARGYLIGIGRAAAIMLAEAGANVVCVDKDHESAQRTVQMIQHLHLEGRAVPWTADITNERQCQEVVDFAEREFGRVDILVNNVGVHGAKGTAETVDLANWDSTMQINVKSMISMAKYAIPAMQQEKPDHCGKIRGSIINVASVNGIRGGSPDILYPTSKGAIVNMTRAMAAHHGPSGITVNCVCPGKCKSDPSCT
jgi:NAD(P)-dependent dehydrogenase (short-subunit alcohol dehydrogenase family)